MQEGRAGVGPLLLLGGALLIVAALVSARWLHLERGDAHLGLLATATGGKTTIAALLVTTGLALLLLVRRSHALATVTMVVALVTAAATSLHVLTWRPDGVAGGAYTLALFALALVTVGAALTTVKVKVSHQETGDLVDGKRDGRWHIYRDGVLIEMREYRAGKIERTIPYGTPPPADEA